MEITTYRDTEQGEREPFLDTVNVDFFFPGADRRNCAEAIKTALTNEIPLVMLTGSEGSGKTMICRVVEDELSARFISVYLPKAINSFDEMRELVVQKIGLARDDTDDQRSSDELLTEVVTYLSDRNIRLVIFFDEAEKIYLATLERVRKLLDRANKDGTLVQFVFSGRETFRDNLEQLVIVTFEEAEELNLSLAPLGVDDALAYLNHCARFSTRIPDDSFSRDDVEKVAKDGTSFRRLNRFATELFRSNQLDTSFLGMIELEEESVSDEQEEEQVVDEGTIASSPPSEVNIEFLSLRKLLPGWVLYGAAFFTAAVALFLWARSGDEAEEELVVTSDVPIIELKHVVPVNEPEEAVVTVPEPDAEQSSQESLPADSVRRENDISEQVDSTAAKDNVTETIAKPQPETGVVADIPEVSEEIIEPALLPEVTTSDVAIAPGDKAEPEGNIPAVSDAVAQQVLPPEVTVSDGVALPEDRAEPEGDIPAISNEIAQQAPLPGVTAGDEVGIAEDRAEPESDTPAVSEEVSRQGPLPEVALSDQVVAPDAAATSETDMQEASADEDVGIETEGIAENRNQPVTGGAGSVSETDTEPVPAGQQQPESPLVASNPTETEVDTLVSESTSKVMVEPLEEKEAPFSPEVIKESQLPAAPQLPEVVILYNDEKKYKQARGERQSIARQPRQPEQEQPRVLNEKQVDALFLRRIAAGARWLVGGGRGKYTVQLMVLTSEEAEDSLKEMLKTVEYQSIADELYVLRRTGPDPTVMVFYGEHPSLAAARKSRNNLPRFLRKHNPYAISVFGAVEKATAP